MKIDQFNLNFIWKTIMTNIQINSTNALTMFTYNTTLSLYIEM